MEAQSLLSTRRPSGLEPETYSQWVVGAEDERAFFKYEDQESLLTPLSNPGGSGKKYQQQWKLDFLPFSVIWHRLNLI